MKPYKRSNKNILDDKNLKNNNELNYREASRYDQSFYCELPYNLYFDIEFFIIDGLNKDEISLNNNSIKHQIMADKIKQNYIRDNRNIMGDLGDYDNEQN